MRGTREGLGLKAEDVERIVQRVVAEQVDRRIVEADAALSERVEAEVAARLAEALPAAVRRALPRWIVDSRLHSTREAAEAFVNGSIAGRLHPDVDDDGNVLGWSYADGTPARFPGEHLRDWSIKWQRQVCERDPFDDALRKARAAANALGLLSGAAEFERAVASILVDRGQGRIVSAEALDTTV